MRKSVTLLFFVFVVFVCSSQTISTNRDIYNFDVGDVFHTQQSLLGGYGASYIYNVYVIHSKYYSQGFDTIYYVRSVKSKTIGSAIPTSFSSFIDTIFYTSLDSLVNFGNIDSVYYDTALYNGRKINLYENGNFDWDMYVDSIGMAINLVYYEPSTLVTNLIELKYYQKGNEEWGTPIFLGFENEIDLNSTFKLYPNPATTHITIDWQQPNAESVSLQIFSSTGRLVQSFGQVRAGQELSVVQLSPGIYLLEGLTAKGQRFVGKFVKE